MKLLLDTHALLWWATLDAGLSRKAKKAIADDASGVFVSAASAWEIATKVRIGKLEWPATAGTVKVYALGQGFRALPISLEHAERAGQLQSLTAIRSTDMLTLRVLIPGRVGIAP